MPVNGFRPFRTNEQLSGFLLSPHALEFFRTLLHDNELAAGLVTLGPGGPALKLTLKLRSLSHGAFSGVVAFWFVGRP